ncbi:rare lipoprotein A [Catalinimonas alkaloidigena]|uniref:septal ring lytic transglycosylase RlpA family protein n=1 Tax=Catalinimonas alkaloidigena TaxID=1075417 RepID=UPI00240526B1|nr:septal ring lytic transglycosylase RlpA family protein [Catalinimonas alkaloidigena]MDF9798681.1 rare lipoprotein A [Catalinimonas alkaloidigena]
MFKPIRLFQLFLLFVILACHKKAEHPYNFIQEGIASYYASSLSGNHTASGEVYHPDSLTAAHRYLPLGTEILVINPKNHKQVLLKVNDRGPFHGKRILDISHRAADSLGIINKGVAKVIVKAALRPDVAEKLSLQLNAANSTTP